MASSFQTTMSFHNVFIYFISHTAGAAKLPRLFPEKVPP